MCKYVPTKNLQLPLKLALARLPSDELNCLWGEIRALISNKECAKILTQVYLVLLKSGLPVFDCAVFRSSIIPRIFCALVLEEIMYDITVEDFTDPQEDEDGNGFDFKKFIERLNKMYGQDTKTFFSKLATKFVTACTMYLVYITASCHNGNEFVESFNYNNSSMTIDAVDVFKGEGQSTRSLPLLMTNVSASSNVHIYACDSCEMGTKIFQSNEKPMVVNSSPEAFVVVNSVHRGDTFELITFSLEEFAKMEVIKKLGKFSGSMSSNHNLVSSPGLFTCTKKVPLSSLEEEKNDMYHTNSRHQLYSIPYKRLIETMTALVFGFKGCKRLCNI